MRVIGGTVRGRSLTPFAGRGVRPTPDRVREALFSILYSRRGPLTGCSVLDLFAGSGALGIEALSRGAGHAWFVDQSRQAVDLIRSNLQRCGFAGQANVIMADIWRTVPMLVETGPFDLVFADPPYADRLGLRLLQEVERLRLLAAAGLFCLETAPDETVPDLVGSLRRIDQRRYGSTMLHFFRPSTEELA
jgi:16S rRNA (guanine(966)-N(2))-methyltransferase RsmD